MIGLAAAVASATLFGISAVWQARASRELPTATTASLLPFVRAAVTNRLLLLVVAAYLLGFVLHAVAIWLLPLYLAQATVALSLPITAAWSAYRLGEPLGRGGWGAMLAVVAGIVLLAVAAGPAGATVLRPGYVGTLWAMVVLTLALGVLVRHRGGAAALGAVAGFGYAGSALAVRALDAEPSLRTVAAALVVPSISLVAFWLYSLAMARTRVASATAALLSVQTFAPALVGVLALGDEVVVGRDWMVVVGLVLSVAGATAAAARHPS